MTPMWSLSDALLSEYAYVMAPHGLLCTITDVKELHEWHMAKCEAHPYFVRVPDDEVPSYVQLLSRPCLT